ncbi:MAG TPA: PAS domain S-box protein [Methanoregula sp.]|nr:PAS domain S-box protein [Methanoregula sp.]
MNKILNVINIEQSIMISLLYVDDEPALLDLCRRFLEQEGDISVVTVGCVSDALSLMKESKFDAIISDYQMPGTDGLAFLCHVRLHSPDIPFILFTGRGREEVVIEAINRGADSYVQKGGDPRAQFKELSNLVRQVVRRRKAENELQLMKFSVDHASEGIIWMRSNGEIVYNNDAICIMLGYTPLEFSGLCVGDIRNGFSAASSEAGWILNDTRRSATIEDILRKKDGSFLPVEIVLNYNEREADALIFAFIRDISERRRSEQQLKSAFRKLVETEDGLRQQFDELRKSDYVIAELQERYRMLSEVTENWIWETAADGRFTSSTDPVKEILGYSAAELSGKTFADFMAPDSSGRSTSELVEVLEKREAFHSLLLRIIRKDGSEGMIRITGNPVFSRNNIFTGFYGIGQEVTSISNPVNACSLEKPVSRPVLDAIGDAIFVIDEESGMIIDANQNAFALVKRPPPEICTLHVTALYPAGEKKPGGKIFLWHSLPESEVFEDTIVDRDGNQIPVLVSTKLFFSGDRKFRIAIFHNISDLYAIRETLEEKNSDLDRFFKADPDLVCVIDTEGKFLRVNPAGESLLGCNSFGPVGQSLYDLVFPEDLTATRSVLRHLWGGKKTVTFFNRILRPDGSVRWLEWQAFLSGSNRIFAIARDITDKKMVEQTHCEANQKLGLLTDLTHHDIKNKLTVLSGYLNLFGRYPDEPYFSIYSEKINELVAAISVQVEFARIYRNLGILSPEWYRVDLLVSKTCSLLNTRSVAVYSDAERYEIFSDPLIERVFYTLMDNALCHGTTLTKIRCNANEIPSGLKITIEDNGVGIAQEYKEQIFGKEFGKSSGHCHSLFLAREILSITGMIIHETGQAGKGARFEIHVPKGMYRLHETAQEEPSGSVPAPHFIFPAHHNHTS